MSRDEIPTIKEAASGGAIAGRLAGAVGMVLLASTVLTFLLTEQFGVLVIGKLVLGGALIITYLATNLDFWGRLTGSRSSGLFAISIGIGVIVVGLIGVANYLVVKNDKEIDLTREGIYTLSDQTVQVLGRLKKDIKVFAFFASYDDEYVPVKETLERYAKRGPRLSFVMVDPQLRDDLVEKYKVTSRGPRVVITSGDQEARVKDISEEELTHAIIKVAEETSKRIYFLTGHGEADTDDDKAAEGYKSIALAIRAEGYEVEKLSLLQLGSDAAPGGKVSLASAAKPAAGEGLEIPAKVSVLVISAPKSPLFEPEIKAVEDYLERGGRVVVLTEPNLDSGLEGVLAQWKIAPQKDIIIDTNVLNRLVGLGPASPMVVPVDEEQPITKGLSTPTIMSTARSLTILKGGEPGVETTALVVTSESAWGETNPVDGTAAKDDLDNPGPLNTAVVAVKKIPETDALRLSDEARLVVFGDSDWIDNGFEKKPGNADLFLNTINWLAEQSEKIAIRPKTRAASQLFLSVEQLGTLKFFSMDILPVLLVAMGLGIVMLRRQR
jgi:ABC-type uncharacterized transport system involved in gliding motility auxiliary subunit